jgi:exopolyphosphatase / guanosine-5'-triphosphate,3'-diphosphate pyrophosphatase
MGRFIPSERIAKKMPTFAAIDIGSNSCRLKIARVHAHRLKTLAEDREVTRLGGSVFDTGLISPEAMAATLRALKRFQRAVQSHGVDRIRVVATAAMRDARNSAAFQAWVKAETGWNMEIISGLEEGRLIHLGVTGAEPGAGGRVLLLDLGGGSCEVTLSEHKHIKETVSLPLGAVRLTEQFLSDDPAPRDGLVRMRQLIARELRRAHRRIQPGRSPLVIATSGTAAALSAACALGTKNGKQGAKKSARLGAKSGAKSADRAEDRAAILAGMVPARAVRKLAGKLAKMSLPEREAVPGIGPRRAEIIVAGAEVYAEIFESFNLKGFRYSPLGLRDGILAQMLAEQDARAKAHREFEHERWESVLSTARRYGVDPRQADPVRAHTVQLFRELKSMHELQPEYESWLAAAAMLRDTGNSSTTRAITGTRNTSSPARRFTATPNCSARWSRPSRATWARAAPSPATALCATFPPTSTRTSTRRGPAASRIRIESGSRLGRSSRQHAGLPQAGLSGVASWAHRRGIGVVVAAQGSRLLPRGLRARALRHAGINSAPCVDPEAIAAAADAAPCRPAQWILCASGSPRLRCPVIRRPRN